MTSTELKGTIVLTGSNGDLGRSIVAKITSEHGLAANYHAIYTVRDVSSASALMAVLKRSPITMAHRHEVVSLDLERLDDVYKVAADINKRIASGSLPPIQAVVLNAGYLEHEQQTWVEGGLDTTWVVNYLSHWLLTLLLLGSMDRERGRLVVIGSHIHDPYDRYNYGTMGGYFDDDDKWKTFITDSVEPIAKGTWSSQKEDPSWKGGLRRYAAARMCLVMMIAELQCRLDEDPLLNGISILGVDPGWMATGIARRHPNYSFVRTVMPWVASLRSWLTPNGMFRTPDRSAGDIVVVMFGEKAVGRVNLKGLYFKGAMQAEVSAEAKDREKRQMVWKASVSYAHFKEGDTLLVNWK